MDCLILTFLSKSSFYLFLVAFPHFHLHFMSEKKTDADGLENEQHSIFTVILIIPIGNIYLTS